MNTLRRLACAALLLAAACDDDKPTPPPASLNPDAGIPADDAGSPSNPGAPDAGAPDAASGLIPIEKWLHQIITEFGPMNHEDTVEDKPARIKDTDDPAAFDPLLMQ